MELRVGKLVWTPQVEEKLTPRGITPELAEEVRVGSPQFYVDKQLRAERYMMLGPCADGRFLTIIVQQRILELETFDVITGWPSDTAEVRLYEQNREEPQ